MLFSTAFKIINDRLRSLNVGFRNLPDEYQPVKSVRRKHNGEGYMVTFERIVGHSYISDYFPDKHQGENLICNKECAWELAQKFASATRGLTANVYVIDSDFNPVAKMDRAYNRPDYKASNL